PLSHHGLVRLIVTTLRSDVQGGVSHAALSTQRGNLFTARRYNNCGPQEDIREVTVGRFAHCWAIHAPQARDGSGIQPHLHLLFSPRREDVELDRTPAQW